ncbi:hypothetical protein SASPL_129891 [Salvia splendens]|uniref:Uncharacterized protein n=1 Tax=Salvia splendens TaxID=180675 RepID=A0A8X8ZNW9_SALSN|nr:hypothetical protein SASPL_129891 [Salvia splendens]
MRNPRPIATATAISPSSASIIARRAAGASPLQCSSPSVADASYRRMPHRRHLLQRRLQNGGECSGAPLVAASATLSPFSRRHHRPGRHRRLGNLHRSPARLHDARDTPATTAPRAPSPPPDRTQLRSISQLRLSGLAPGPSLFSRHLLGVAGSSLAALSRHGRRRGKFDAYAGDFIAKNRVLVQHLFELLYALFLPAEGAGWAGNGHSSLGLVFSSCSPRLRGWNAGCTCHIGQGSKSPF